MTTVKNMFNQGMFSGPDPLNSEVVAILFNELLHSAYAHGNIRDKKLINRVINDEFYFALPNNAVLQKSRTLHFVAITETGRNSRTKLDFKQTSGTHIEQPGRKERNWLSVTKLDDIELDNYAIYKVSGFRADYQTYFLAVDYSIDNLMKTGFVFIINQEYNVKVHERQTKTARYIQYLASGTNRYQSSQQFVSDSSQPEIDDLVLPVVTRTITQVVKSKPLSMLEMAMAKKKTTQISAGGGAASVAPEQYILHKASDSYAQFAMLFKYIRVLEGSLDQALQNIKTSSTDSLFFGELLHFSGYCRKEQDKPLRYIYSLSIADSNIWRLTCGTGVRHLLGGSEKSKAHGNGSFDRSMAMLLSDANARGIFVRSLATKIDSLEHGLIGKSTCELDNILFSDAQQLRNESGITETYFRLKKQPLETVLPFYNRYVEELLILLNEIASFDAESDYDKSVRVLHDFAPIHCIRNGIPVIDKPKFLSYVEATSLRDSNERTKNLKTFTKADGGITSIIDNIGDELKSPFNSYFNKLRFEIKINGPALDYMPVRNIERDSRGTSYRIEEHSLISPAKIAYNAGQYDQTPINFKRIAPPSITTAISYIKSEAFLKSLVVRSPYEFVFSICVAELLREQAGSSNIYDLFNIPESDDAEINIADVVTLKEKIDGFEHFYKNFIVNCNEDEREKRYRFLARPIDEQGRSIFSNFVFTVNEKLTSNYSPIDQINGYLLCQNYEYNSSSGIPSMMSHLHHLAISASVYFSSNDYIEDNTVSTIDNRFYYNIASVPITKIENTKIFAMLPYPVMSGAPAAIYLRTRKIDEQHLAKWIIGEKEPQHKGASIATEFKIQTTNLKNDFISKAGGGASSGTYAAALKQSKFINEFLARSNGVESISDKQKAANIAIKAAEVEWRSLLDDKTRQREHRNPPKLDLIEILRGTKTAVPIEGQSYKTEEYAENQKNEFYDMMGF